MTFATLVAVGRAPAGYHQALTSGSDAHAGLLRGLALLPSLVPGCRHASTTTSTDRGLRVWAATDERSRRADDLQREVGEGPVLQALRTGHSVIAHHLATETRWPRWHARVVPELGLGWVVSVLLLADRRPLGTLNLYGRGSEALVDVDVGLLHALADPLTRTLLEVVGSR